MNRDTAELLRDYAENRQEVAFAAVVQIHIGMVYGVALRQTRGDRQLAEDVTQTVFAQLASNAAKLSRHPAVSGWLYRTAQYKAIDAWRGELRRSKLTREIEIMNESAVSQPTEFDPEVLRPELDEIVAELGERDRNAIALRFFEGRAYHEIGQRLHLTENAARMRLERALEKLRAALARRGITSSSAAISSALASVGQLTASPALINLTVSAGMAAGTASMVSLLSFMSLTKAQLGWTAAILAAAATVIEVPIFRAKRDKTGQPSFASPAEVVVETGTVGVVSASGTASASPSVPAGPATKESGPPAPGPSSGPSSFAPFVEARYNTGLNAINKDYDSFLASLNLGPERTTQFKDLILALWAMKTTATNSEPSLYANEVAVAQQDFRRKAEELLGAQAERYFAWESAAPGRREYDSFLTFMGREGLSVAIGNADAAKIVDLIAENDFYTFLPGLTVHPFEEQTRPFSLPKADWITRYNGQIEDRQAVALKLGAQGKAAGLDDHTVQALNAYVESRIQWSRNQLLMVTDPNLAQLNRVRAELEKLRSDPDATPAAIAAVEGRMEMWERVSGAIHQ